MLAGGVAPELRQHLLAERRVAASSVQRSRIRAAAPLLSSTLPPPPGYALGPRLELDVDLLAFSVAEDLQGHGLPRALA